MTNINENTDSSNNSLKIVGWIVLGLVILIVAGSIILFLLQLIGIAIVLAGAAFVGWLAWLWIKNRWEKSHPTY